MLAHSELMVRIGPLVMSCLFSKELPDTPSYQELDDSIDASLVYPYCASPA